MKIQELSTNEAVGMIERIKRKLKTSERGDRLILEEIMDLFIEAELVEEIRE